MNYQQATFLTSAAKLSQLPPDQGAEVAFAGRSNAGKSSALNVLTNQNRLARTSKTPGRTQLINFFVLDEQRRLVDLPGYGYAKVSEQIKQRWQKTLAEYLETRRCLKGLILLMDIRHPLKDSDLHMLNWAHQANLPIHILLTKQDKLSKNAAQATKLKVTKQLQDYGDTITVQTFSSLKKTGIEPLTAVMDGWLHETR